MKLIVTSHLTRRFVERTLREKIKEAYIIPPKILIRLGVIKIPLKIIQEKKYLYAYEPFQNELFFLQIKDEEIVGRTFVKPEGVIKEQLLLLVRNEKLKKVGEEYLIF